MIIRLVLLVLISSLLIACQDESKTTVKNEFFYVEVTADQTLLWSVSASTQLRAIVKDQDGIVASSQPSFVWSTSNAGVATVSASGLVTAVSDGTATITASGNGFAGEVSIGVNTSAVAVSGQVRYEDQYYSQSGITGTTAYKPVRFATIDLLDGANNVVQTTTTDSSGNYSLGISSGSSFSIRVIAKTASSFNTNIEVTDMSGNLYAATQTLNLSDLNTANVDISIASGLAGAYNIMDVMSAASEWVASLTATVQSPLRVSWALGNAWGTYYCSAGGGSYCFNGSGIYVLSETGLSGDHDEFDDDVLLHEYGHYITHTLSADDSPGGCHAFSSLDLDVRLAWSEGWGNYVPAAVKSWLRADVTRSNILSTPVTTAESVYIDTYGTSAFSKDMANPGGAYIHSTSEIAVAKMLWDVTQQFGATNVWDVMENYIPLSSIPVSFDVFYDGWINRMSPAGADLAALESITAGRQVYFTLDAFEDDSVKNLSRSLAVGGTENHYLYQNASSDSDVVAFDVVAGNTYRVETYNLMNGVDTYLKIVNGSDSLIAQNDNVNSLIGNDPVCGTRVMHTTTALASVVQFTASTTETLYAVVSAPAVQNVSAGRYGSYSLKITQQ